MSNMLKVAQVQSQEDLYIKYIGGNVNDAEKRKMAMRLIEMSKNGSLEVVPSDLHTEFNYNPSMAFDEQGRLKRWEFERPNFNKLNTLGCCKRSYTSQESHMLDIRFVEKMADYQQ